MANLLTENSSLEIKTEWPEGYVIWNIGRENFDYPCFIPLCITYEDYTIERDTLVAFYIPDEQFCLYLMDLACRNTVDKETYERIRKDYLQWANKKNK